MLFWGSELTRIFLYRPLTLAQLQATGFLTGIAFTSETLLVHKGNHHVTAR
jgi:hypothetical protein